MKIHFKLSMHVVIISLYISFCTLIYGQTTPRGDYNYNDGPYISIVGDSIHLYWIEAGNRKDSVVHNDDAGAFERPGLPFVDLSDLEVLDDEEWEFPYVNQFIALSDLHGQFDIFTRLLKSHGVVNENLNWIYGSNHLIITGDHFSRGEQVMDILWLLFKLEKEAARAGGKVHTMLGNHELMTLNNDLRYMNKKYYYTSGVLQIRYDQLFSESTVLGKWLRKKNVVITVNDILFVHGGISRKVIDRGLTINEINRVFKEVIMVANPDQIYFDPIAALLVEEDGPLWYRGYADVFSFNEKDIDRILDYFNVDNIVVGHTSLPQIKSRFDHKIIFIDCDIKMGERGELLIWKEDNFYRGLEDGTRIPMRTKTPTPKRISLFEFIDNLSTEDQRPKITLLGDVSTLMKKKLQEEYVTAQMIITDTEGTTHFDVEGRMRSRGNMRKKVCRIPPIKFDFSKKELRQLGFVNADKIKFVLPCKDNPVDEEKMLKEFFIYKVYSMISPYHIKAILVDVEMMSKKEKPIYDFKGLIIEDENAYAFRNNAKVVPKDRKVIPDALEREHFAKMMLFQYMIGNTDWAIHQGHNLDFAKHEEYERVIPLPYDYDYSGLVNQGYAIPHPSLPIKHVTERYFMPYKMTDEEFYAAADFFKSKEKEIMMYAQTANYMKESTRKDVVKYLTDFFKLLKDPKDLKQHLTIKI
ncbi:MAG TPA: metallophosphoesterase [Saprospiraceae bacterium]|nr:metallophosphoesterase [Saprospiraceae bacterium]